MTIHPTHHCFDDAIEILQWKLKEWPDRPWRSHPDLFLVHAIVRSKQMEGPFAHGWVEESTPDQGVVVWQAGLVVWQENPPADPRCYFATVFDEFAKVMQIDRATRYTPWQAVEMNRQFGTFGPWEPEYLALCGNKMEARKMH